MIVVKLKAGLGNQMFQYALGRRLSLDWQDELILDLSWFANIQDCETRRKLEIDKFNTSFVKITNVSATESMRQRLARILNKKIISFCGRLDKSYHYRFRSGLLRKRKYIYLDGYFQSYKYFATIRKTLIEDFVLKKGFSLEAFDIKNEIERADQSVAMHIRRTDYLTSGLNWHGICGVSYYEKGLEEIRKVYNNIKLFIFSDDIAWAENNLKFDFPTMFVSRPTLSNTEEMLLMSLCKHQIIANSSFSWWAAWLNINDNKIVIAPSQWLLVAEIDTKDLLPAEWIIIKNN